MAAFNVYLSYPIPGGYSEFIDITEDCLDQSIGNIVQSLESNEYDVGKITFSNIKLVLRNEHSYYSEATNPTSIFPVKRDKSIIKIEYDINSDTNACGWCYCGETFLSAPVTIFKGLLEENTAKFDVIEQTVTFSILGLDSIINKVITPFSSLNVLDDFNTLVYTILNQAEITQFFTVDSINIDIKNNLVPDSIVELENKNCLESLQEILLLGNSIMFVRDDIIYVKGRDESPISQFVFYGPSSDEGLENILELKDYSPGLNRTFNSVTWANTDLRLFFIDSIEKYGERIKEFNSSLLTDDIKRQAVLNSYLSEFGFPKLECTIVVPMYTPIVKLGFLDKVNIDFPSEVLPTVGELSSRYGQAVYGNGRYNVTINSLFISISQQWKILNSNTNIRSQTLAFKLREV